MVNCVSLGVILREPKSSCFSFLPPVMSIRLYVGNLPQSFDAKELEALFESVGAGVRFKAVNDRETGGCRGFGFANVDDAKLADAVIEQLNGRDFGGNALRIEISERRDSRPTAGPGPLQLVGNSIGGVVSLNAARLLQEQGRPPEQVVLIDCAQRALDGKRLAELPPLQRWSRPLLMATVRQRWLIQGLFQLLARPAVVRQVLAQAYPSGGNVDEELVNLLFEPSRDPGAPESFRGFVNLFNDRLAPQLLAELNLPVRMLWGEADPWEPVAEARRWAATYPCVRDLTVLPGLGHCPHDEAPERVNPILVAWLSAPGPR